MKIDKNIPMPPRGYELPFGQMEVGDSFALPSAVSHSYARILIHKFQTADGKKKFSLRRIDDSYRCWRVK